MNKKIITHSKLFWWGSLLLVSISWLFYVFTNCDYWPQANCTGFFGKTIWDVLELLIVPVTLAIIASYLDNRERKADREIALDNQREAALQKYFDVISDLVINYNLNKLDLYDNDNYDLINIALNRTYATLRFLDTKRKSVLVNFLSYLGLIHSRFEEGPILFLENCDFQHVILVNENFDHAYLRNTNFAYADLSNSNFKNALLNNCNLNFTNLTNADFTNADLSGCTLHNALINNNTIFLNAIMPDGNKFNSGIHSIVSLTKNKHGFKSI